MNFLGIEFAKKSEKMPNIISRLWRRIARAFRGDAQQEEAPLAVPEPPILGLDPIRASPELGGLLEVALLAVELGDRTNGAVGWTSEAVARARDFARAHRSEDEGRSFRLWASYFDRDRPEAEGPARRRPFPEEYRGESTRRQRPRN